MFRRSALGALLACLLALAGCGGGHVLAGTSHGTKNAPKSRIASNGGGSAMYSQGHNSGQSAMGSVHPAGWGSTPKGVALPAPLFGLGATQTALMYDAVTVGNIPANPFAVAGYPFGHFITWPSLLRDFPGAHHVSVAVALLERAMCGDFEPGDMSGSQAGQWARLDMASFKVPCEYGDLSNMPAIEASDRAWLGPDWRSHVLLWLAWYRNLPGLVSGYDGVQYTDTCLGRNLDCSTVSLRFLQIASPPYVPPPPPLPWCFTHRETVAACNAVKAKIASWERAAAASTRAYDARGCLTLWNREQWFAQHVNRPPASKRGYRQRAEASSLRAYRARGCPVLNQRIWWFLGSIDNARIAN